MYERRRWVGRAIEIPDGPTGKMHVTQASYPADGTVRLQGYVNVYVVVYPDGRMERRQ